MTREHLYLADAPHCARILRRTKTECENPGASNEERITAKASLAEQLKTLINGVCKVSHATS
jgi:hypothetical protein